MATKPKASSKKAAPTKATSKAAPAKAATKSAPDLFNQPSAPKKATVAKPRYTVKGTQVTAKPAYKLGTKGATKPPYNPKYKAPTKSATTVAKPTYKIGTQGAAKAPYSPSYKGPTRAAAPAAKSLATRVGSALKGKGTAGLVGGMLAAGAAASYSAYKRGTGTTKKKAAESPAKDAAPVSIIKDYNRRDEIGKPSSPMVLKKADAKPAASPAKPAASKGGSKSKGSASKAAPKRPGQIALAKGIGAKDIKLSSASSVGKGEVKSIAKPAASASESKPKYSKMEIAKMETRAGRKEDRKENRAERKSERMENRAERLEKRAGKLKGKLKYGGAVKAKNGKSFPDLNKDGKITKADILKGRGVIAKKGASVRKAGFGDMLGKAAKSGVFGLAGMAANKLFGGKKKAAAPAMGAAPMGAPAAAPAAIPAVAPMKKGGKIAAKKKMMKSGGKMAKCKYGCK